MASLIVTEHCCHGWITNKDELGMDGVGESWIESNQLWNIDGGVAILFNNGDVVVSPHTHTPLYSPILKVYLIEYYPIICKNDDTSMPLYKTWGVFGCFAGSYKNRLKGQV